jgi:hypothetical protein
MRAVAEKVFACAPNIFTDYDDDTRHSLMCNYALRAGWVDILSTCLHEGFTIESIRDLASDVRALPKCVRMWLIAPGKPDEPGEPDERECCICLDGVGDAVFHPCAHNEIHFACARDLTTCPICRTEGYAKKVFFIL